MKIKKLMIVMLVYSSIVSVTVSCGKFYPENYIYLEIPDLVEVEDGKILFTVGETLWMETATSRYLPMLEEAPHLLDVFETTGEEKLHHTISIYRKGDDGFYSRYSNISAENVNAEVGETEDRGSSLRVESFLNEAEDAYESRVGIVLTEPGEYALRGSKMYTSFGAITFTVSIETTILNANEAGYEFTVME